MAQEPKPNEWAWLANFDKIGDGESLYLGDPEIVGAMVRTFLHDAIKVALAWRKGLPGAADPERWLAAETSRLAKILLGQSADYVPVERWNAPDGGIIAGIRRRYSLKAAPPEAIVAHPFYMLVKAFLDAEKLDAEGGDWEGLLDGEMEIATATLLGMDDLMFPPD